MMPPSLAGSRIGGGSNIMTIDYIVGPQATGSAAAQRGAFPRTAPAVSTSGIVAPYDREDQSQVSSSDSDGIPRSDMRNPRGPRPSYSEEQKFFIMFLRIIHGKSWPEIGDAFDRRFGKGFEPRSKGGLTSVYYRIRKSWGLSEVLSGGPDTLAEDTKEVVRKAGHFSRDFLVSVGYL